MRHIEGFMKRKYGSACRNRNPLIFHTYFIYIYLQISFWLFKFALLHTSVNKKYIDVFGVFLVNFIVIYIQYIIEEFMGHK